MSKVYISKTENRNIDVVIGEILDKIFASNLISSTQNIVLKPNFINSMPANSGVTTDLRIVEAAIKWFISKNASPKTITIAEAGLIDTSNIFFNLGVDALTSKYNVKLVNLETEKRVDVDPPLKLTMKKFSVPEVIYKADIIVNLPKLKTHDLTMLTMGLKNFFAFYNRKERKKGHVLCIHDSIIEMYAWIKANKKVYSIIDAVTALEGKLGPTNGQPKKLNLILASDDTLSLDIVCTKILNYPLEKVIHLERAVKHGLGESRNIEIVGESLESIKTVFDMPYFINAKKNKGKFIDRIYNTLFRNGLFVIDDKCVKCKSCIEICPQNCIRFIDDRILIDKKRCIECYCCIEVCEAFAFNFEIRFKPLLKAASGLKKTLKVVLRK
jgi:uncharacterized protein (DUF362 family)/Pyruvate/2-oxoacid:ferredoxin oxidoreductase delta subunit